MRGPRIVGLEARHRADLVALWQEEAAFRHLGGPRTQAQAESRVEALLGSAQEESYVIEGPDGQLLGIGTIGPHHDRPEREVSYIIHPTHWRQGHGRRLLEGLMARGGPPLVAETRRANLASSGLLRSVGFLQSAIYPRFGAQQALYLWEGP